MGVYSIKAQLMKSSIAFFSLLWVLGVLITVAGVRHEATEIFDSALRETADHLLPVVRGLTKWNAENQGSDVDNRMATYSPTRGQIHYVVRDRNGEILMASNGAPIQPEETPLTAGFHSLGDNRVFSKFFDSEGFWIIVVQEMQERQEATRGLWIGLVSPLLALLPLAALGNSWLIRQATAPISVMSRELEAKGSNDLTAITVAGLPSELAPIGSSVNKLLQRIRAALDAERSFSANAAHELRNPIAGARAQLQLLSHKLRGGEDGERVDDVISQLDRLGRRSEKLLQMSRAEAGIGQSGERADIATVATLICDEFRQVGGVADRLKLEVDHDAGFSVAMDMDALAIVLRNAIENAVIHGFPNEPIVVRVGPGRSVRVINGCDAIPAHVLDQLKGRFSRGNTTRFLGSGIGLTIMDSIMRQAGGTADVSSPAIGSAAGFQVVLQFPESPLNIL